MVKMKVDSKILIVLNI